MEIQKKRPTVKGPADMFTGDVWFDVIAAGEPPSQLRVNVVRFSPGAHTAWHRHANGQTLHVTSAWRTCPTPCGSPPTRRRQLGPRRRLDRRADRRYEVLMISLTRRSALLPAAFRARRP
jgi:hypothetical protein